MSNKLPKYAKDFKNHRVLIFEENGSVTTKPVYGIDSGTIETDDMMLPVVDSVKHYDNTTHGFTFVFNLDLPAKVEAENLYKLRRSMAINNLFTYDREKGIDLFKLMPYLIAGIAVIF